MIYVLYTKYIRIKEKGDKNEVKMNHEYVTKRVDVRNGRITVSKQGN